MKKIAIRNFLMTGLTIIICIVMFSGLLLAQLYRYSIDEKNQSLERDALGVSALAKIWITEPYKLDTNALKNALVSQSAVNNTRTMISDENGGISLFALTSSSGGGGSLDREIVEAVKARGVYKEIGTLGGYFANTVVTVGVPVRDDGGNFRGAVFVSAPLDSAIRLFRDFAQNIFLITVFVLGVSAALIYFVSQKFTRPLKDMAHAARSFAMGDFSARVTVTGNDEIAELACAFNNMADSVEKLEKLRKEFIANISHELKTPMTTIAGFVDGILDGTIGADRQDHYLRIVSGEVQRLSRLVSKLLLATRLQSGAEKLKKTNVDICALISSVIIRAEQAIEEKGLKVEINFPKERLYVLGDYDALIQVVTNLADNAVKYSDEGGSVAITVSRRNDRAFVSVFNTGPGIPKEELPMIFERFYKADRSRGVDKTGTGLGLYIVKSIINSLDQQIVVQSEPGRWIRFTFSLEVSKFQSPPELKS